MQAAQPEGGVHCARWRGRQGLEPQREDLKDHSGQRGQLMLGVQEKAKRTDARGLSAEAEAAPPLAC